MPTYDYVCDACEHKFEEFQSFTEKPLKKCPECKKSKLRRLFGAGAAVLFKGSGFYETDYRSESYKSAAKADQEASKPASSEKADSTDKSTKTDSSAKSGSSTETSSTRKTPKSAK